MAVCTSALLPCRLARLGQTLDRQTAVAVVGGGHCESLRDRRQTYCEVVGIV